jgi:hypothetical protein
MNRFLTALLGAALMASTTARAAAQAATPPSAWREGQRRACLKNGDELLGWVKERARNLGRDGVSLPAEERLELRRGFGEIGAFVLAVREVG